MKKVRCVGFDNLAETLNDVKNTSDRIAFVGGGTRFVIAKNRPDPDCIVDLSKVRDLKYITEENNCIRIGAGTTFAEIASNSAVQTRLAALSQAAEQIGSVQNRNRATLGGNIAGASPASDSLPVLAVFDARIVTVDPEGGRTLSVAETVSNACQSTLGEKEIIKEIIFPYSGSSLSAFRKLGCRTTVTRARLNMAVRLEYDQTEEAILGGKVVLGAVGPLLVCPKPVNDYLRGCKVNRNFAREMAGLLSEVVKELKPVKEFLPYKVAAVRDCGRCGRCLDDQESRPYKTEAVKALVHDLAAGLFGDRFDL